MTMVSGATSRISLLSPRKFCMAVSSAASASSVNASANRLDCLFPRTLAGCSLSNRFFPSAAVAEKAFPWKVTAFFPAIAPPSRAAPNFSRVR